MAFNRFTKNVLNVSGLPDRVQNQAQTLKATFDQAGVDIKQALNGLISELEAATSASNLGADVSSVTTKTVQAILTAFELEIANRYTKNEIDTLVSGNTNDLVADVDVNLTTGVITVTKKDGAVEKFDTALEKVPAKFEIVESGTSLFLKITNVDGTSTQTNITDLMNIYDFNNTNDIAFNVSGTGNEKVVTASIRPNSIGLDKLSLSVMTTLEGYMTSARDSASAAKISETNARNSANTATKAAEKASIAEGLANTAINKATEAESYAHGGTGSREGEDTDNAKYYSQIAKQVAGGDFVTTVEMEAYAQKKGTVPSFEGEELSGDVIEVDSLLAIESKLKISGNSEQDSRSGKNIAKINETDWTLVDNAIVNKAKNSGSTIATINLKSGQTLTTKLKMISKPTTSATFTFTKGSTDMGASYSFQNIQNYDIGTIVTRNYTATEDCEVKYVQWGNANSDIYKFQLWATVDGDTLEEYEPYGAMPSPDYPAEIRSVKSKSDNILPQELFTTATTVNGITFTPNADGSIKIKGTATARADLHLTTKLIEKLTVGKTYTSSIGQEMTSNLRMVVEEVKGSSWVANISYASKTTWAYNGLTSGDAYRVLLAIDSGSVLDTTIYPMINEGDKALPYQPYGYVPVELKVEGKNLFDKDNFETLHLGIDNNTKVFYNASTFNSFYIKCKSNTTYTVSKISSKRFTIATCMDIPIVDGVATNLVGKDNGTQLTITSGINDKYLWVYYYKSDTDTLTEQEILDTIQVEEGSTATAYEPYKGKTVSLPLGDIELRSTPDGTRDTFVRVDGVWNYRGDIYSERALPKSVASYRAIDFNPNFIAFYFGTTKGHTAGGDNIKNAVSNRFVVKGSSVFNVTNNAIWLPGRDRTVYISIEKSKLADISTTDNAIASFKTWLEENPLYIDYVLATPTYTPITDAALIQALDELENLILHKGYNRITVTSVNGVKAYLDLAMPPTASVTEVVETDSELDMPIPVVSNTGDVKVKIPAKNQMTLNPFTGEVNVKGLKINGKNVTAGSKLLFEHTLTSEEDSLVLENLNLLLDNLEKAYIFICARKAGNAVTSYRLNDNVLYNNKGEEDTYMLIECLRVGDKMFITTSPVTTNLTDTALKSPIVITSESIDKISINPADTDNYDHKLYAGTTVVIFK